MEKLIMLVVVAIIAESVWETLKMTWQDGKVKVDRVGALVVSMLIVFGTRLDMLSLLGIETVIPFLGIILTGILISRGSNFIHDLLVRLSNKNTDVELKTIIPSNTIEEDRIEGTIKDIEILRKKQGIKE
ncbi:MAG: hypothetical protein E7A11_14600 [Clostridium sp.]|uniref:hypothetical protein n=2 Tax=Clostridium sp. TaxID=1506 RepID=UPI0029043EB0|nr:hypothetical protein [Clostridium sp.]MDU1095143.1 hypothetical protein [Clostridioides difficile]MDU1126502.1 hypothetical protein [Clostridium sp.]MDU3675097.1 hypothetical protein [Clostridium sp.]